MSFSWLKFYFPKGLYARAALIMVLPVVTVQLIVSVLIIQRHFDEVTVQMTKEVAREVRLILAAPDDLRRADLAKALQITLHPGSYGTRSDDALWYDLTESIVRRALNDELPSLRHVDLSRKSIAVLYLPTKQGEELAFELQRLRLSVSNPHQLFVNMIFFGGLMTLIAFVYMRNQLRPIKRLAAAAQAFGRGRVVPYRPSGAVEVRAAGNAFLDMRARIERQIEQRTMMLSGVSHDLRTPLTRFRLGLSLLDEEERADLERDVDEMQSMLDGFLAFAEGAADGTTEAVDPFDMLRDLVADHQREGQDVTLVVQEGEGTLRLRPLAMRRAVDNLVNNAVRYGTRAELSISLTDKALRIRVEDDGPGIPADQREEAIKPFARLDAARNQNRGSGVGLGLAISADIARAHGGVLRLGASARLGGLQADLVIGR